MHQKIQLLSIASILIPAICAQKCGTQDSKSFKKKSAAAIIVCGAVISVLPL